MGIVRVRTRDEVTGPRSGVRASGGAVDLMLELLSCHATLPDSSRLASYRCARKVKVLKDSAALRATRDVVANSGKTPREYALHSLRMGAATALAPGSGLAAGVAGSMQREKVEVEVG